MRQKNSPEQDQSIALITAQDCSFKTDILMIIQYVRHVDLNPDPCAHHQS